MAEIWELIKNFALESGIAKFFVEGGWKNLIMIALACVLLFLAIKSARKISEFYWICYTKVQTFHYALSMRHDI